MPQSPARSAPDDLALHGVRVLGFADAGRVAGRYGLGVPVVEEALLDGEAAGLVRRIRFADLNGWSITEAGRDEDERRLAAELDRHRARDVVVAAHAAFLPLNRRFTATCTDWQIRPTRLDPMAVNDHDDSRWDDRVLSALTRLGTPFTALADGLAAVLARFTPYASLYATALGRVDGGHAKWIDAADRDSLHLVWIQFHEDLLATLGIPRGAEDTAG